jgi:hypothetical protein
VVYIVSLLDLNLSWIADYTDREFSPFFGASPCAFNKYTLKYATARLFAITENQI